MRGVESFTKMLKIGIECHNLEGERFGVGQTLIQLLESLAKNSAGFNLKDHDVEPQEAKNKFRFVLYFKKQIPADAVLNDPIFEKKILRAPFLPPSFNIFYHILLPVAYFRDKLNGFFLPSYMMPAFFIGSPPHLFIYNTFRYLLKKISFNRIALLPIKSRCGGKSITILTNDVYYESHYGNLPFKYKIAYRIFSWLAAKRANKIMTISEFSKKELAKLYKIPADKITVIAWGLNEGIKQLAKTPENIRKINEIKQKFGIENKYILSVGQAFPRRKIKESMLAFEKIANRFPDFQYLIACVDKYRPPILNKLTGEINKKLGKQAIVRADYLPQNDIIHLFNHAELLLYISSNEAMGLPPMEALKCGSVPLVADNDLTREMFGDNAFFVKNIDNPDSIAKEMENALTNAPRREKIIREGQVAMQKFSWQEYGKKLLELFEETFK